MEIIDFYKQGAQVVVNTPARKKDMRRSFTSKRTAGGPVEIGHVPKGNAKPVKGPASDVLDHRGTRHLLLKAGHVYDVTLTKKDGEVVMHTISAEAGHITLPLPVGAEVETREHDPNATLPEPASSDAPEETDPEATLGDESGEVAAAEQE